MILDFSKDNFNLPNTIKEDWEKEILDFLKVWRSNTTTITVNTSGSTGSPKVIQVSKNAMKQSAIATGLFFNLAEGDTALLCLPVSYIAGKMMLVRAIVLKLKLFCIKPSSNIIFNQEVDFVALTPMQINQSIHSVSNFRKVIIGGSKLGQQIKDKLVLIKNTQFFETYGMTETVSHVAIKNISKQENFFSSLPNISIFLDNRGCLCLKVPYISDEQIITNDLVEIIDESKFKLIGRIDNVINSGGIKILPEIVEEKLKTLINSNFVISSIKDDLLGEKLVLIIEGVKDEQLIKSLEFNFKKVLSKFEIPREILFKKEFPKTTNGKIIRNELKN